MNFFIGLILGFLIAWVFLDSVRKGINRDIETIERQIEDHEYINDNSNSN